ncbi:MAG TPA: hypothetical protein VLF59_03825 [Candidatus Saccharimonadales bacterium]|nr:hypothetical protein [Candidatus Saccharimonadales bacterium]
MVATALLLDRPLALIDNSGSLTDSYVFDEAAPILVITDPQPKVMPAPAAEILLLADVMPKQAIKLTWSAPIRLIRWLLPVYAFAMLLLAYGVYPLLSSNVLARVELPVTLVSAALYAVLTFRPESLIGRKTYQ